MHIITGNAANNTEQNDEEDQFSVAITSSAVWTMFCKWKKN